MSRLWRAGGASSTCADPTRRLEGGARARRLPSAADGRTDRIRPAQGHGRAAAAARRVVQARAPRTDDDRRAQRRGQDDAAADARRRDVDRPGRAEPRQGRADRAARPAPAARARPCRCASTCCRAAPRSSRSRPSWPSSSGGWPTGRPTRRCSPATPRAGAAGGARRLPVARPRDRRWRAGWASREEDLDRGLDTLLRRPAHARVARARARHRARTCCCWTSPPTTSTSSRWSGSSRRSSSSTRRSCWSRTTAGSSRPSARPCWSSEAGRSRFFAGHLAPVAPRAGGARDGAGQGDRQAAGGDRAHGAVHRALPLQGHQGAPGAVAREAAREDRAHRARPTRRQGPRVRVRRAGALGPGDLRAARRARRGRRRGRRRPRSIAARARRAVARARRARLAGRAQRVGQDDADRDARRTPRARGGQAQHRPQREGRLPLPARRGARRGRRARARACSRPRSAPPA